MKRLSFLIATLAAVWLSSAPVMAADGASASVTCKDGTTSIKTGKGACSHHGGVQKSGATSASSSSDTASSSTSTSKKSSHKSKSADTSSTGSSTATTPAPAPSTTAAAPPKASTSSKTSTSTAASGQATAKCKDGTMSYAKHHQGACSHHGGVAQFLDQ
jgi:hypothetical protein